MYGVMIIAVSFLIYTLLVSTSESLKMFSFQRVIITAHGANKNAIVLRSDRDFEK